jgi:hypothetical protein
MSHHITTARRHTVPRVAYRWLAGRPLDGRYRTNATWLYPGTAVLAPSGRATRWARLPGWRRQVWRHGTTAAVAAAVAGYAVAPLATEIALASAETGLTAYGTARAVTAVRLRKHRREWVRPLDRVLAPALYPAGAPAGWLHVPLDHHAEGEVRVEVPGYLAPERRKEIVEIVRLKLGMTNECTTSWNYAGRDNHLTIRRTPRPRGQVLLDDAREAMLAAPESAPLIGYGRRDKQISVDLDSESPHILISAGTGAGKSVTTRAIVCQLMRYGAQVTFLDVKRQSHRWAVDLAGVTYCRDTAELHEQLIALAAEGDRRNRLADGVPLDVDTSSLDLGPRIVIVAEEMNATIGRLQTYWDDIREKSDPKKSPAVAALADILFMGRAVKIHVIAIAQMMTARSLGGPEARENFATRILARYTLNAWRMLCPEIWPAPKSTRHKGRCQVVIGGEAHETQVLFLTDKEARDWAESGQVTPPVEWTHAERGNTATPGADTGRGQGVAPGTVATVTLAEAARRKVVPLAYGTLRAAKSRDENFPAACGRRGESDVYRPVDLIAWHDAKIARAAEVARAQELIAPAS